MNHTPWELFHNPPREIESQHGEASRFGATIVAAGGPPYDVICELDFGYGKKRDAEVARLIAAAPELLEALEMISSKGMGGRDLYALIDEMRTIARRAIHKARSE